MLSCFLFFFCYFYRVALPAAILVSCHIFNPRPLLLAFKSTTFSTVCRSGGGEGVGLRVKAIYSKYSSAVVWKLGLLSWIILNGNKQTAIIQWKHRHTRAHIPTHTHTHTHTHARTHARTHLIQCALVVAVIFKRSTFLAVISEYSRAGVIFLPTPLVLDCTLFL